MSDKTKGAASGVASQNSEKALAPIEEKKKTSSAPRIDARTHEGKPVSDVDRSKAKYQNQFSFTHPLQVKIVNCIMKCGKKSVAQKIMRDTLAELSRAGEKDPLKTFELAFQNATPTMEVTARRIGGAVYQIPTEIKPRRQESLSIRWILQGARSRKGQPMHRRLAQELLDASRDNGYAVNKKKEVHKMAQANKAFAHLARY